MQGYGDLNNIFSFGLPAAQSSLASGGATTKSGLSTLDQAGQYFKSLMSGDRTKMMQAVAPETNAVHAEADAAKRQTEAMGTARGGGTAVANNTADTNTMAKIDNLLFGVRPGAAGETAKIGGAEAGIGLSQQGIGANLLGIADNAAGTLTGDASKSRETSAALNRQVQQDWANAITGILGWL